MEGKKMENSESAKKGAVPKIAITGKSEVEHKRRG